MLLQLRVGVRCGTEKKTVKALPLGDGTTGIAGKWAVTAASVFAEPKTKALLEDLANAPVRIDNGKGMQAMLHFVKKWGPLFQQWGSGQDFEPENPFAWIWCQVNLRAMWESRGRQAEKHHWPVTSRIDSERLGPHEKIENLPLNVQLVLKAHRKNVERERAKERETWQGLIPRDATGLSEMEAPHLTLRSDTQRNPVCAAGADTIEQFAKLMVFAADASRLRMCWRPDCPTPYFIADDLKAHYCSEDCSRWSRAEHKRNWWKERGSEWRESKNERKSK